MPPVPELAATLLTAIEHAGHGVGIVMQRERRPEYQRRFTFITGGSPEARAEALIAAGEVELLAKPFDRGALLAVIERRLTT